MKGKNVFITGGGQGIGKAMTGLFLKRGAQVTIAEIDPDAGHETLREYRKLGRLNLEVMDISDEQAVRAAIEQSAERAGGLDLLINNAAVAANGLVKELSLEQWNRVLGVNLTGPFLCAKHAATYLSRRKGNIINIGSTRTLMSEANTEAYSASKGGIVALTHALAVSLGPDIRVNCISPGWIDVSPWKKRGSRHPEELTQADHEQHPAGRVGIPEDVANLALYLASEQAGFITGQNFIVDGGMTRKMIYV